MPPEPPRRPLRASLHEVRDNGPTPFKAVAPAELFAGVLREGTLTGPVTVEGTIYPVDETARLEATAKGTWRFECTRCLKPVDGAWREEVETEAPLDSDALDATEDVRQAIALAEPMKTLCRPDCKGLCPVCRANRNDTDCGHAEAAPPAEETRRPRLTKRHRKG
ncbi:MAG: DUF177 domain-containing protein [Elusimicrobia bacterium]|nr:DUF177 domain-containing protein [Elusimicrobiota bacterium]